MQADGATRKRAYRSLSRFFFFHFFFHNAIAHVTEKRCPRHCCMVVHGARHIICPSGGSLSLSLFFFFFFSSKKGSCDFFKCA
ncbi:hypothetical protein BC940DRAFT_25292 [Gongronella butleri]|nr:hypothetical protein BC940DRAFT_25292 [Gongronella butleri]